MRQTLFATFITLTLAAGAIAADDQQQTTIVVFGDSYTAPRPGTVMFSELLEPGMAGEGNVVRVINAGVARDNTAEAAGRFQKDVLAQRPDIVILQFGVNDSMVDVWKNPPASGPRVKVDQYVKNLAAFIDRAKAGGAKVVLLTPHPLRWTPKLQKLYGKPPYDTGEAEGLSVSVDRYADAARNLAKRKGVMLADVHAAFIAHEKLPGQTLGDLLPDGMHPSSAGHRVIADLVLGTLRGEAPAAAGKAAMHVNQSLAGGGKHDGHGRDAHGNSIVPGRVETGRLVKGDELSPMVLGNAPRSRPVRVPGGELWAFAGRSGDHVMLVTSRDNGLTWERAGPAFEAPPGVASGMPSIDADGEIHVVFLHARGSGRPMQGKFIDIWYARSTDGRTKWKPAKRIWEGYCGSIMDLTVLGSGRIVAPFAAWVAPGEVVKEGVNTGSNYTITVYSDDGGETWKQSPDKIWSPCYPGYNGNNYGAIEPTILELRDGRSWMLMRTQTGYLYETFSPDGATWSEAKPAPFWSSTSPAALVRMASGRIVNFWNNCEQPPRYEGKLGVYGGRDALHAAYSDDEGKTWRGFREVYRDPFRNETPPRFGDRGTAYPTANVVGDHTVALSTGQGDRRALIMVDDRWLEATTQVDDFSGGLGQWHVWKPINKPAGWWRDRQQGAKLIDHPDRSGAKVLHVRHADEHHPDAAVWNFPMGAGGTLRLRLALRQGFGGATLTLNDRFFDPNDPAGIERAIFVVPIAADGTVTGRSDGARLEPGKWHEVELTWNRQSCGVQLDGVAVTTVDARQPALHGISYVRITSTPAGPDPAGLLVESAKVTVQPGR
jgi:lysophospholipase L1-like esterase